MIDLKVHFDMRHRTTPVSPYYSVFINITLSLCGYLNGTDSLNPIMKWAYNMMEQSLPKEIIHPCPYYGIIKLMNMTIVPRQQVIQFPKGYYKSIIKLFDTKDDNIATATLGVELQ